MRNRDRGPRQVLGLDRLRPAGHRPIKALVGEDPAGCGARVYRARTVRCALDERISEVSARWHYLGLHFVGHAHTNTHLHTHARAHTL